MIGSGVWNGVFDLDYGYSRRDKRGNTIKDELERIGYLGEVPCKPHAAKDFFEVHIEQGPILEDEGLQIGVLNGVQGMNWYDLVVTGQPGALKQCANRQAVSVTATRKCFPAPVMTQFTPPVAAG